MVGGLVVVVVVTLVVDCMVVDTKAMFRKLQDKL